MSYKLHNLSNDYLYHISYSGSLLCAGGCGRDETVEHIFFECEFFEIFGFTF